MSSHYVYVIVNKKNLKLYFGSHSWSGDGLDPNYYGSGKIIKQAVNKYGRDNFIIQPIKFYNTVEECRQAEEELLTKYDVANNPRCYNVKNAAVGWTSEDLKGEKHPNYGKHLSDETRKKLSRAKKGRKHSEEHRQKISESKKGRKHSENTKRKMSQARKGTTLSEKQKDALLQANNYKKTPIVAIHKDTGKIRIFESQNECARQLNLNQSHIYQCLKGIKKTCKGYIIKYLKRCSTDYKITKRKAKKTEKIKLTTKRKGSTPIVAIDKNNKVKIFESITECSRVLGANPGHICNCLKGRQKTCKGYLIKYVEELESGIYEGKTVINLDLLHIV